MKKIIAIVLTVAMIAAIFWVVNPFTPVYAEEYRSGFLLTPVHCDTTGVYTDTGFILKTEKSYTTGEIEEMLRLLGDSSLKITQNKQNEFLITPEKEFITNSLYTFVITTPEKEVVSWTFQTRRDFAVLGTLPAHQSGYVTINSGIEIYFSHTGFGKVEQYFEISPKVDGRFERNGYAAVFIPKKLEAGTLYTVTIRKGLPLNDTNLKLTEDYIFAFETEPEQSGRIEPKGSLSFSSLLAEFSTREAPLIPINIYSGDKESTSALVKTTVYKYKDSLSFIEAVRTKYEQPYWAYSLQEKNLLSGTDLTEAASFEQTFDLSVWQERYLSLPEALNNGFYLVESTYNDLTAQILIQSVDLSGYFTESNTKTLIWVNSLESGKSVEGAQITGKEKNISYFTDSSGIAAFDTIKNEPDEMGNYELQYYLVSKADQELLIINSVYRTYRYDSYAQDDYWKYFQTDRNLYKPDDLVQFWGFLQDRYNGASPSGLTVEIAEGGYWGIPEAKFLNYFLPFIQKPLVTITVPAENGFFEGNFQLPKLSPGGYQITVKAEDEIINSHYISVENYVKPVYKMTVEKDKKAIFLGETVNFTVIPAFFDGTPLPLLDVSYNMGGYPFNSTQDTKKTGMDGKLAIPFTAATNDNTAQGEQYMHLNVNASLPESGMIYSNDYVRVFINDIYASFKSNTDKDGKTTLNATLNRIDLSRINNNEDPQNYPDFLGEPASNKVIAGTIIYHTYDKIEDGEEYDYINKVVNKRYRYEERREKVQSFSFTTGTDGFTSKDFNLKDPDEGWYTAELIWEDGNGRVMNREVYLSKRFRTGIDTKHDWYHLETDKDSYRLGDEVLATLKNNEENVSADSVLFMEAQKGITKYSVQNSAEYKTVFTEEAIPNIYIQAVYFTGTGYINTGTRSIGYDTDEVKIDIELEADKEDYRPGDTVTLNITARDENGKPVAARINLAIMDEAMLEISHYYVNVLEALYQHLGSGLGYSYSTHGSGSYGIKGLYGEIGGQDSGARNTETAKLMDISFQESMPAAGAANDMSSVQVRTEFKDTALFRLASLSEDGTGTVSFKLPDNVTSWHVTLAGISPDLHGGTGKADLKVTLPFFINDSLNTTYLTGDFPYIGVTGYGNKLKEGENITWQITSPQLPGFTQTVTGKAFERTNIPLWQMEAGIYDIEIKAISESGLSDGIRRTIQVADTYHEIEKAVTKSLKANMTLTGGTEGLTTLIFTDESRGKLIPALYSLLYSGGSRLDQKYTACQAKLILDEIAPGTKHYRDAGEVDLTQYQKSDGGFGILPYSESDVKLSSLLATVLKDEAGARMLKQYFYSLVYGEPGRVNAPALYGLAVMGEPVLVDLNKAIKVTNLTFEDSLYLALAFEALGETHVARGIYNEKITPVLENMNPYVRVKNSDNIDVILKDTALAAVLASKLNIADKDGMFLYITNNYSKKELMNAEKLLYVMEECNKLSASDVEFTYEYDGKTYAESLKGGGGVAVTVPSVKLPELKIIKVSGEASVVSVFKAPLTEQVQTDGNISVNRRFYDYKTGTETTEFKQNDIVKVVLEWNTDDTSMDSCYEITDFAPSGLKPLESPYQAGIRPEKGAMWWFRNTDGQKVTFNVCRDAKQKEPLVYYARVVSPGTFKADGTIIQGTLVKDSINFGDKATIRITE